MTRQEKIQVEIIGSHLEAEGIEFVVEAGKHRMLVARGRRIVLAGSPACDDAQLRRYTQTKARKFVASILKNDLT